MFSLFDLIKSIAPGTVYFHRENVCVPCPVNVDTAALVFIEECGYTVGFTALSEAERGVVIELLQAQEIIYSSPLRAPSITVQDVFVESRKIKDIPAEALAEAVQEASKPHGTGKSLDLIARSLAVAVADIETRLKKKNI